MESIINQSNNMRIFDMYFLYGGYWVVYVVIKYFYAIRLIILAFVWVLISLCLYIVF